MQQLLRQRHRDWKKGSVRLQNKSVVTQTIIAMGLVIIKRISTGFRFSLFFFCLIYLLFIYLFIALLIGCVTIEFT